MSADLLIRGGEVVGLDGKRRNDVLVRDGRVEAIGTELAAAPGSEVLDADGMLVFPGLIDPQVHFREPGMTHKEDLATGSLAALAGGFTSFMEMPNTKPTTTDPERLAHKLGLAQGRCAANYAFFLGASAENAESLAEWEQLPVCAGVKIFMGSSTGDLLVPDDETLERVLRSGRRRVAVHSEDEYRLKERYAALPAGASVAQHPDVRDVECALRSTRRLLDLVEKTRRPVHVLHLSTAEELALLRERDLGELVTCEVTPNHLFLSAPECYEEYGSLAQMNPPVRDARHRDALREALVEGLITCIGSDHAPHTREEKAKPYPQSPSGIPGVQTTLGLFLRAVREGWFTLADIVRVCNAGAVSTYGIANKGPLAPGVDADLVLVDPTITEPLPAAWLESRCAQSPYEGWQLAGWPVVSVLGGRIAYRDHALLGEPAGRPLEFA